MPLVYTLDADLYLGEEYSADPEERDDDHQTQDYGNGDLEYKKEPPMYNELIRYVICMPLKIFIMGGGRG